MLSRLSIITCIAVAISACVHVDPKDLPRARARAAQKAYWQCAKHYVDRYRSTDIDAASLATQALSNCDSHWQRYRDERHAQYFSKTHSPSAAHAAAMRDALEMNIHMHGRVERYLRAQREGE